MRVGVAAALLLLGAASALQPTSCRALPLQRSLQPLSLPSLCTARPIYCSRPRRSAAQLVDAAGPLQLQRRCAAVTMSAVEPAGGSEKPWKLDSHRWVQLALLSLLALVSDWVCFATAAVPSEWMQIEGHDASELIDIFLYANVCSCFLYTDVADRFGLKRVIRTAAALMACGCVLRSGVPFIFGDFTSPAALAASMPSYEVEVLGTILVGFAQPFFQCSPPLLSATWFGSSERALATATAINFNQVGIATAFIVGGLMANSPAGMHAYFDVVAVSAIALAAATFALFRERPKTPPSASAAAARAAAEAGPSPEDGPFELTFPGKATDLLRGPGFTFALASFVASIGTTNVISAFTAPELARAGLAPGFGIDLAGAGFQIAIVMGGILLGRYVDETKEFKSVVMGCLVSAVALLFVLGISEGYDQMFPPSTVVALLLGLGFAAGPVQPISAELAVEVSYPCDENAVEATQQLSGNLFSALLVPVCQWAAAYDLELGPMQADVRGDTLVLVALVSLTLVYFSAFDAPLTRNVLDTASSGEERSGEAPQPAMEEAPQPAASKD